MADDKTTKTPEQPVTDSGPGKETPPAPPKEPEKVSVSPEPEKKTEPEVKNPQVSVYNFAEIMKEKKVEERSAAPSGGRPRRFGCSGSLGFSSAFFGASGCFSDFSVFAGAGFSPLGAAARSSTFFSFIISEKL